MKKLFSILAAALVATAATTPAHAELTPDGVVAVENFNKLESCMKDMVAVLEKVKDKESADAQATALVEAAKALGEQMAAMDSLQHQLTGMPNDDDQAAFEQCRNNLHVAGMNLQTELQRLAMVNFYESEAFIQALMSLQQTGE